MQRTQTKTIRAVVLTKDDVLKLFRITSRLALDASDGKSSGIIKLVSDEALTIELEDAAELDADLLDTHKATSIDISFARYGKKRIEIKLREGGDSDYWNVYSISADDRAWIASA